MTTGVELLVTAQPHYIPGYTGYCPQHRFICGETYAKATHKLLLDPTVSHADTLVLSSRAVYEMSRPSQHDVNMVNARFKTSDSVFVHPMLPGYEGFVPRLNERYGQRNAVLATEGVAEFERQQLQRKTTLRRLRKTINRQSRRGEPKNSESRSLIRNKLPLLTVRPECKCAMKNSLCNEQETK